MRGYNDILRVTQLREEITLSGISGLLLHSFSKHHMSGLLGKVQLSI